MAGVGSESSSIRAVPAAPDLFTDLVVSKPHGRTEWGLVGAPISAAAHVLALAAIILVPIFLPAAMPPRPDVLVNLIYNPPGAAALPLPRGAAIRPQAKPEPPKPVVENPPTRQFTAPIEIPQQPKTAKLEPEQGVRPEDQFGSETGSEFGDAVLGMEGGMDGGVYGGLPGGVPGGVIGGTGNGPVADYDAPARAIKITPPQYPQEAFVKKVEGTVELEILIDSSGRVVRAKVIHSIPLLDAAAVQTVYQWIFQPAVKRGRPVAMIASAPVTFRIY